MPDLVQSLRHAGARGTAAGRSSRRTVCRPAHTRRQAARPRAAWPPACSGAWRSNSVCPSPRPSGSGYCRLSNWRARPKSVTLRVPSAANNTLAGLRSRWTTLRLWARLHRSGPARKPSALALGEATGALRSASAPSEPPSTYSRAAVWKAVRLADFVDLHNVGMLQPGYRLCFGGGTAWPLALVPARPIPARIIFKATGRRG